MCHHHVALFILLAHLSVQAVTGLQAGEEQASTWSEAETVVSPASQLATNLAAAPDGYSMYRHLMETQAQLTEPKEGEPGTVTSLKSALKTLLETALHSFFYGFVPAVERRRRELAGPEERGYLDTAVTAFGAILGMQDCSKRIACRTGKLAVEQVPGAALMVMMLENLVPTGLKGWFSVLKAGVMERDNDCVDGYKCSLGSSEQDNNL